jgi:hypothetical protein
MKANVRCSGRPPNDLPVTCARTRDRMAETTTTIPDGRHAYRPQTIGRVFGWFFLATILTSIPAYFIGYAKMLETPA